MFRWKSCDSSKGEGAKNEQIKIKKDLVTKSLDGDEKEEIFRTLTIPQEEPMQTSLVSGFPEDIKNSLVKISKPSKNVMQSGTNNIHHWQVTFDTKKRWENPLIGWCSSGDAMSNMMLNFSAKEEAIAFCEKNGWKWFVSGSKVKEKWKIRTYGDNFLNKRCRVDTK
ncbi:hypothetical protein JTB14_015772 [Gonioctena quinquepunctata]|nr:hypothetical protein JTB14_015772 [Gonioctena quinquepunctata]